MKRLLTLWITALPILIVLDLLWTTVIAGGLYHAALGALLAAQPVVWPLVLFYLIYSLGIAYFVVAPALQAHSWTKLFLSAALLGLVGYGTYDFVSIGVNANWPVLISIIDVCWGIVITSITAKITYFIAKKLYKF